MGDPEEDPPKPPNERPPGDNPSRESLRHEKGGRDDRRGDNDEDDD